MRRETEAGWRALLARARGFAVTTGAEVRDRIGIVDQSARRDQPAVFVSYRRKAEGVALGLVHELRETPQAKRWEFFFDQLAIPPGAEWERYIGDHLAASWVLLLVVDRNWNEDRRLGGEESFVRREIELAHAHHVPVIPVLVDGGKLPPADELPESIRWLHGLRPVELYNPQLRAVMVANLAEWLKEIHADGDATRREVAKSRKTVTRLEREIEDVRGAQTKAERDANEAARRQSEFRARLAAADQQLAEARAQIDPPREPGRIRVCVNHEAETADEAARLTVKLRGALGDEATVEPLGGDATAKPLTAGCADRFDVLVVLIGPRWMSGSASAPLLEGALARGIPVLPVLVGRLKEPSQDELPDGLRGLFAYNFLALRPEFWEPATDRLCVQLDELDALLARRERAVANQQSVVERNQRDLDRVGSELTRAQEAGRAAAEAIATLERQATHARAEVERLEQLPADRGPAFIKGPPPIRAR